MVRARLFRQCLFSPYCNTGALCSKLHRQLPRTVTQLPNYRTYQTVLPLNDTSYWLPTDTRLLPLPYSTHCCPSESIFVSVQRSDQEKQIANQVRQPLSLSFSLRVDVVSSRGRLLATQPIKVCRATGPVVTMTMSTPVCRGHVGHTTPSGNQIKV